jgi:large subunit ribosomal protein L10
VFLADYRKVTVADVAELRTSLGAQKAEFHVVKNSILNVAVRERKHAELDAAWLIGQTAIIVGGRTPAEVAKILLKFSKDKDKVSLKGGLLGRNRLSAADVVSLSTLPSIEVLRARFLGLLSSPASQLLRVLQAVPQSLLNVLHAKGQTGAEAASA